MYNQQINLDKSDLTNVTQNRESYLIWLYLIYIPMFQTYKDSYTLSKSKPNIVYNDTITWL